MAKKKRKRGKKKGTFLKMELIGLLFIFLAILGSGASAMSAGAIPGSLESLFRLLLGNWYFIASLTLLVIGIYLIVKRKWPVLFTRRLFGVYLFVLGVLLFTHIRLLTDIQWNAETQSVLGQTWSAFQQYSDSNSAAGISLGGGMIGAVLLASSHFLFAMAGAMIVAIFGMLVGILFITNLSIGDAAAIVTGWTQKVSKAGITKWKETKVAKDAERTTKQKPKAEKATVDADSNQVTEEEAMETVIPEEESAFPDVAYASEHAAKPVASEPVQEDAKEETATAEPQIAMTATENYDYKLPSPDLLEEPKQNNQQREKSQIESTVKKLDQTFKSFGVKAKITKVHVGPSVTKYEVYPDAGVKVSKIVSLHDDLALALAAKDIRIEAPIPGKSAVGIEVPNKETAMVSMREVLDHTWSNKSSKLLYALGRDISGEAVVGELNKMPHLLIAGATGSGKSVCVNGIITSILMRAKPHEVKMMMIDPKKVELNVYNGIPHLLSPVVTDPKKASRALKKVVSEMERRYDLFSDTGTRNIEAYNEYVQKYNQTAEEEDQQPHLPYIVVLVDELADLMMVASNDVEDAITRLAQMARAAGIHLIIATQRPSVDVITGVIKANIPSRIAFSVSSQTDSRTILDSGGAEKLLGRGDMLFMPVGNSKPTRVQGAFLSDEEVERVVNHCISEQKASYQEDMIPEETSETVEEVDDELFDDAVQMITEMQSASVSMLQRRFRIGYTRAARLIDAMEDRGIVGPYEGSKPRTVLVSNQTEEHTS